MQDIDAVTFLEPHSAAGNAEHQVDHGRAILDRVAHRVLQRPAEVVLQRCHVPPVPLGARVASV